ncbi:hypothetical protein N656DRAFT_92432 [Canariomyces notabilis]|uniref:Secreted protein n=1 Tax=Canariomyces notabilis TaxID=2074819 RepID=A0AAN6YSQ2_9PEZI|nr:hypothetical protein N656DRAFT_92432 [Canariomyces arenarius]
MRHGGAWRAIGSSTLIFSCSGGITGRQAPDSTYCNGFYGVQPTCRDGPHLGIGKKAATARQHASWPLAWAIRLFV